MLKETLCLSSVFLWVRRLECFGGAILCFGLRHPQASWYVANKVLLEFCTPFGGSVLLCLLCGRLAVAVIIVPDALDQHFAAYSCCLPVLQYCWLRWSCVWEHERLALLAGAAAILLLSKYFVSFSRLTMKPGAEC